MNKHTTILLTVLVLFLMAGRLVAQCPCTNTTETSYWEPDLITSHNYISLDVVYHEDFQAKRNKNGIINFNTLSKCAMSLLVEEKTFKKSKTLKQQRAFAQRDYRELILNC